MHTFTGSKLEMYDRLIKKSLKRYTKFPVIALLGPRQSGKTTLAQNTFAKHTYINFEHEPTRSFAQTDPEGLLALYENKHGIIIDEFQYVPNILSYIQIAVDEKKRPGYFILTGSQNFLANQAITQSLAGRVGILNLFPLSIKELTQNKLIFTNVDKIIFAGGYPRVYDNKIDPAKFYPSYIQTYVERDVRQIVKIGELTTFQKFLQLCASNIGQQLNITLLASQCGITFQVASSWLSLLQASYIIFPLEPHFRNFNKRLTKTPKIYFFDTGLACSLLRITSYEQLALHPLRPSLFESFIIADLYKQYANASLRPSLYFWRDLNGRYEIDCILDEGVQLYPVEIKSGKTIVSEFYKAINYWKELAQSQAGTAYIIYGGNLEQPRKEGTVLGWKSAGSLIDKVQRKK